MGMLLLAMGIEIICQWYFYEEAGSRQASRGCVCEACRYAES